MIERKELNKLIVMCLSESSRELRAIELYSKIRNENPKILKIEKVKSFRSFVKVINMFPEVEQKGYGVKRYDLNKSYKQT